MTNLYTTQIETPLGNMIAVASDQALYLLEFTNRPGLEQELKRTAHKTASPVIPGGTPITESIQRELQSYFAGTLAQFKTPVVFCGSPFQNHVWQQLKKIPLGQTRSYANLAQAIGRPSAFRAVAKANSTNQLALIVPCHRVINKNGNLGGYAGGLSRKQWLIDHEKLQVLSKVNL